MAITIKQLQHIISIIENDGYRNAAKSGNITQAGISNSIKTIETFLGEKIFQPNYKTTLTPYGEIALPWIREFVDHYDRLYAFLLELADGNAGDLRISCLPTILNDCMPQVLKSFQAQYSHVNIALSDNPIDRIHRRLLNNEIDIGICTRPSNLSDDIEFIGLYDDPLGVLLPIDHPLTKTTHVSPDDIKEYDFISNGMTRALDYDQEIKYMNDHATQHIENVLSLIMMVEMGAGISIMGNGAMQTFSNKVVWVPLNANLCSRQIGVLFHKNKIAHPTVLLFVDTCKRELLKR